MRGKLKEYLDHIGYSNAGKNAKQTMWGVILVKFGTGAIGIWGIISIYFFSFYKMSEDNLKMTDFTFLVTFAALPMSIVAIFSIKFSQKYGFKRVIRTAMIISPLSLMCASFQTNFYMFAIFNSLISSICFGATVMPVLYCLWSHFPKNTGSATGIALASFGLSAFFYSIIATLIVNPNNIQASIEYVEGQQTEVSDNVPKMLFWLGFIQLFFCIPGAFMITDNTQQVDHTEELIIRLSSHLLLTKQEEEIQQSIEHEVIQTKCDLSLMQGVKSSPFLIIYFSTFLLSCFSLFISINFKMYGLTKINDDHFLTFLITFCTLISSFSNLGWGYLVDKYKFRRVYLILIIVIFISAFFFPYFTTTKFGFYIVFQVLSSSERGLYTIIGPGLVQIFGIKLGAELFPIKSTSFFLALVFLPIFQMIMLNSFSYDQITHLFLIILALSFILSYNIKLKYSFQR